MYLSILLLSGGDGGLNKELTSQMIKPF